MKKISFVCPDCQSDRMLEEILGDVTQSTTFDKIDNEFFELDYRDTSTEGGIVLRYQCSLCGYVLKNKQGITIGNTEDLFEWLYSRNMV